MSYVAGVVPVLDQTAEEILLENPRYLTRVKNYPTFFSFGPDLITLDEVLSHGPLSESAGRDRAQRRGAPRGHRRRDDVLAR